MPLAFPVEACARCLPSSPTQRREDWLAPWKLALDATANARFFCLNATGSSSGSLRSMLQPTPPSSFLNATGSSSGSRGAEKASTTFPTLIRSGKIAPSISKMSFSDPQAIPWVAVAKVAQKRGFHRDFRPFPTLMGNITISIRRIAPSGILGKNRGFSSFLWLILANRRIATFCQARAKCQFQK